jgi:hypothetical protein
MRKAIPHALLATLTLGSLISLGLPLAMHYSGRQTVTLPVESCTIFVNGASQKPERLTVHVWKTTVDAAVVGQVAAYEFPGVHRVLVGPKGTCMVQTQSNSPAGSTQINLAEMVIQPAGKGPSVIDTYVVPAAANEPNVYACGYFAAAASAPCDAIFPLFAHGSPTTGLHITGRSGATIHASLPQADATISIVAGPQQWRTNSYLGTGLLFSVVKYTTAATGAEHAIANAAFASAESAARLHW